MKKQENNANFRSTPNSRTVNYHTARRRFSLPEMKSKTQASDDKETSSLSRRRQSVQGTVSVVKKRDITDIHKSGPSTNGKSTNGTSTNGTGESKRVCDVCLGKKQKEVESFCSECQTYLCHKCSSAHRKASKTQFHTLFTGNQMPSTTLGKEDNVGYCKEHAQNVLTHFCPKHEEGCCAICKNLTHKRCGNLFPLNDVVNEAWTSPQYKTVTDEMKGLIFQFMRVKYTKMTEIKDIEIQRESTIRTVEAVKESISQLLNKLDATMKFQLEKVYEMRLRDKSSQIQAIDETIVTLQNQLDKLDDCAVAKANDTVFIEMTKTKACFQKYQSAVKGFKTESVPETFEFNLDRGIEELSSNLKRFNDIKIKVPGSRAQGWKPAIDNTDTLPERKFSVRQETDGKTCDVPSITLLSNGYLLLTDLANLKVKLFDSEFRDQGGVRLGSKPFGGAEVGSSEIVLTIPNRNQMLFLTLEPRLKPGRTIPTKCQCLGIIHCDGKLIVGCQNPAQIQIIDITGIVLKTIKSDANDADLFQWPNYLSLSKENAIFYVCDPKMGCVYALTVGGTVLMKYEHKALKDPTAVAVDPYGRVFIAGHRTNNIKMISFDGLQEGSVNIPSVVNPQGMCFVPANNTLIVSSNMADEIHVFSTQREGL